MINCSRIDKNLVIFLQSKAVGHKTVISQVLVASCRMSLLLTLDLGLHPQSYVITMMISYSCLWYNHNLFHDIKCISANLKMTSYVGAIKYIMWWSFNLHKKSGSTKSCLVYTYGSAQRHIIGLIVQLNSFTVIM